ncbi:hypothetical protein ER12_013855 (plasmid) [Staphylococcus aureus]|nr:hypothetical protein ER12_013855 [Staphylococcus aureus]
MVISQTKISAKPVTNFFNTAHLKCKFGTIFIANFLNLHVNGQYVKIARLVSKKRTEKIKLKYSNLFNFLQVGFPII